MGLGIIVIQGLVAWHLVLVLHLLHLSFGFMLHPWCCKTSFSLLLHQWSQGYWETLRGSKILLQQALLLPWKKSSQWWCIVLVVVFTLLEHQVAQLHTRITAQEAHPLPWPPALGAVNVVSAPVVIRLTVAQSLTTWRARELLSVGPSYISRFDNEVMAVYRNGGVRPDLDAGMGVGQDIDPDDNLSSKQSSM